VEPAEIAQKIAAESSPGDVVLVMSNGGFGGLHGALLDRLTERFGPA
jgi:UDP-N-acetylmuramate: L-alanyl-gamma-D-glutamyl-meso-diaminopimelate ligase